MKNLLRNILLLFCHVVLVQLALPSGWKTCDKNDTERNKCLQGAITGAIQSLINGNKKLGVLPIDPLRYGTIHTRGDSNRPVALDVSFNDVVLHNLRSIVITSVELKGRNLKIKGKIPGKMVAESPYVVKGKLMALPLTGAGKSSFNFWNTSNTYELIFRKEPEERNGKKYLIVEKVIFQSNPEKVGYYLENLFNGNKQLGDTMNKLLNDNWEIIWDELKPLILDAISEAYLQLSNRVFSHIPMDDINLL